ncbi:hypothetical protein F4780DRAFT_776737 [Xylariomycetidae sp. FL0641]|nr:hypothetical protein F4780DRAFT_776737 [Xylariomycetidae sp. FL0641]
MNLSGISYYLSGIPETTTPSNEIFQLAAEGVQIVPITHVRAEDYANSSSLKSILDHFGDLDDVWTKSFKSWLPKSAGSRAYFDLYATAAAHETGPSIRHLLDLGAVVVGAHTHEPDLTTLRGVLPHLSPLMDTPALVARSASRFAARDTAWYVRGRQRVAARVPRLPAPAALDTPSTRPASTPLPPPSPARCWISTPTKLQAHRGDGPPAEQLGAVRGAITSYQPALPTTAIAPPPVALNAAFGRARSEEALANKTALQAWVESRRLVPLPDTSACCCPAQAGVWFGWKQCSIAQLAGVPEIIIPLGQLEYVSKVTRTKKYLPVAVSTNAAAGCDLMLHELVRRLAREGIIPGAVNTGPSLS